MASPKRDNEHASRVLADAETMGDDAAAAKHKVSTRTVRRYRELAAGCPELATVVLEKRRELSKGWLEAAKSARMAALDRGLELAKKSDNLRDVTGFLKIVHDAVLADEMINTPGEGDTTDQGGGDDELDRRGNVVASSQSSGRQVQGGTTTH